jgi:hypothetical protein
LVVNPNAVLAFSIASQPFEPVTRGRGQIAEYCRRVQDLQLLKHCAMEVWWYAAAPLMLPESFRLGIRKSLDHVCEYYRVTVLL